MTRLYSNICAFLIVSAFFTFFIWSANEMVQSLNIPAKEPVNLDYVNLFYYSLRTMSRMICAIIFSLIFSIIYATLAVKNKYCEQILIPILDIFQSVPILGYISFTVTGFLSLFSGSMMGAEAAAIFAIFTSQVWNMTFSMYESLKSEPREFADVASVFNMNAWQKFWRFSFPNCIPPLIWNMSLSISSGWFFVVAAEVISVGNTKILLPGIGSYIYLALEAQAILRIIAALVVVSLIIMIYDQLLIRPFLVWSMKFKNETTSSQNNPQSVVLDILRKSILSNYVARFLQSIMHFALYNEFFAKITHFIFHKNLHKGLHNDLHKTKHSMWSYSYLLYLGLFLTSFACVYYLSTYLKDFITITEALYVFKLIFFTFLRIIILLLIVLMIWVPIGIIIGLNAKITTFCQPIIHFLSAFPINLLFPIFAIVIKKYQLNPDIWLGVLMIIGSQWYILFNVIAAVSSYPNDFREVTRSLNIRGWILWKRILLPASAQGIALGAITAYGSAWNSSVVAEMIQYGDNVFLAEGIGSYIAIKSVSGEFHHLTFGLMMMCLFIVIFNRLFWKPILGAVSKMV